MIVHDSWWSNGSARSTIIDYHEPFGQGVTNNFLFNDKHAPSCLIKRKLAECNDFSDWNYIKSSENKQTKAVNCSKCWLVHTPWMVLKLFQNEDPICYSFFCCSNTHFFGGWHWMRHWSNTITRKTRVPKTGLELSAYRINACSGLFKKLS